MENKEALNTLHHIKDLMEKSTKFLSLSGISSILIGMYACIGSGIAYTILRKNDFQATGFDLPLFDACVSPALVQMCVLALVLLVISLSTVVSLSYYKAKKANQNLFIDKPARRLLWNFFLPLVTGGILCLSLVWHQHYGLTSSVMLIFYGLALVNCSKYTYSNTRYLGYAEILLGLIDSFAVSHALVFWVIGFGILHIASGLFYYLKVERPQNITPRKTNYPTT